MNIKGLKRCNGVVLARQEKAGLWVLMDIVMPAERFSGHSALTRIPEKRPVLSR